MAELNRGLVKQFKAGATIEPYRLVIFGAAEDTVIQATAATDALIGISSNVGYNSTVTATSNNRYPQALIDIQLDGIALCTFGGTVTRGQLLTSDSTGRVVAAAPAAGVNNRTIGIAMESGVVGDVGSVLIRGASIQG